MRELGAGRCASSSAPRSPSKPPSSAPDGGSRLRRGVLSLEHVPVELGRPAHGLAGVVDDEVEPVVVRAQVVAERLDARRVAQVEPEDLEPVAPLLEVVLACVPLGRVAGEARGHDEVRARRAGA